MIESPHNEWAQRSDVYRTKEVKRFDDILEVIEATYRVYNKLYDIIGPWNAKQSSSNFPYIAPSREFIQEMVKTKPKALSEWMFNAMISSSIKFCEQYKGKRQIITPHPSSHHSGHWSEGAFNIKRLSQEDFPVLHKTNNQHFKPTNMGEIKLEGIKYPIYIENIKDKKFKYVIIRPKLGKLGTASVDNWEVLLFTKNYGFNFEHTDSNLNPRYSGLM